MLNRETWEETRKAGTRDRETRLADSREKRDLVRSKIREGYFQAKGASSSAEFAEADALLAEALAWMKNGLGRVQYRNPTDQLGAQHRNHDPGRPR
jgi:hypothetical protein